MDDRYTQHERTCLYVVSTEPAACTCVAGRLAANPYIGRGALEQAWLSGYLKEPVPLKSSPEWMQAYRAGEEQSKADTEEGEAGFEELASKATRIFTAPLSDAARAELLAALCSGERILLNGVLTLKKQCDDFYADRDNPTGAYIQAHYIGGEYTSASDSMEEQDLAEAIIWAERLALSEPPKD